MKYILVIFCVFISSLCESQEFNSKELIGKWISTDKQDSIIFSFEDSVKFSFKSPSTKYILQSSDGKYKFDITKHPPVLTTTTVDEAGISSINKWIVIFIDENSLTLQSDDLYDSFIRFQKLKQ